MWPTIIFDDPHPSGNQDIQLLAEISFVHDHFPREKMLLLQVRDQHPNLLWGHLTEQRDAFEKKHFIDGREHGCLRYNLLLSLSCTPLGRLCHGQCPNSLTMCT